jgi:hypothetical protein
MSYHIVCVVSLPLVIPEAPNEGIGRSRGPHAVELGGVPNSLVGNLWYMISTAARKTS